MKLSKKNLNMQLLKKSLSKVHRFCLGSQLVISKQPISTVQLRNPHPAKFRATKPKAHGMRPAAGANETKNNETDGIFLGIYGIP